MLRALRRQLRTGGRTAFFTIHVGSGLSPSDRRRAARDGPPAVVARADHISLLERAGYTGAFEIDVTDAFLDTARAWLRERTQRAEDLVAVEAQSVFDERQEDGRRMIRAIEDGLLRRSLFVATRP